MDIIGRKGLRNQVENAIISYIIMGKVYATENALYVDTCLLGPPKESKKKEVPSYPVIVLQIMEMGLPVVFK